MVFPIAIPLLFLTVIRLFSWLLLLCFPLLLSAQFPYNLLTTPERTAFEQTTSSEEVNTFIDALKLASPLVHTEDLFTSDKGRLVQLVVLASPKVSTPAAAAASGKTVVYFQGNIHGGEVEGKEALLVLLREMTLGKQQHLLDSLIVVVCPNYNPDGNDQLSSDHRTSQEHCPHLVGARRSGGDYDLNRDGVKLDATETKALMEKGILRWDPDLFVDMHTTNGVWHANELTYAHSYQSAGQAATSNYTRDVMLPSIQKTVLERYDLHFDVYGGYSLREGWPPKNLYTYNHHPRYLVNQFGLRNKMAILSETFAHDKFYQRIQSAHKFALEILHYCHQHGRTIQAINAKSARSTVELIQTQAGQFQRGVRFKRVPEEKLLHLRTYEYLSYQDSTGATKYARTHEIITVDSVKNYSAFAPTVEATVPRGYVIPATLGSIVTQLRAHGIQVQQLSTLKEFSGEAFMVDSLSIASRPFEHHNMVQLHGKFEAQTHLATAGDYVVDLAQPLAFLIFYLLEPQSDDGLVTWNFFDKALFELGVNEQVVRFPVFKYW